MRTEVVLGVENVKKSSEWYRALLHCKSNHGGNTFEILTNEEGETILSLHKWGEHDHPTLQNPQIKPGNGLILYFKVYDLEAIWRRAQKIKAQIEAPLHLNPNSQLEEFSLRDPDGYYISISATN